MPLPYSSLSPLTHPSQVPGLLLIPTYPSSIGLKIISWKWLPSISNCTVSPAQVLHNLRLSHALELTVKHSSPPPDIISTMAILSWFCFIHSYIPRCQQRAWRIEGFNKYFSNERGGGGIFNSSNSHQIQKISEHLIRNSSWGLITCFP